MHAMLWGFAQTCHAPSFPGHDMQEKDTPSSQAAWLPACSLHGGLDARHLASCDIYDASVQYIKCLLNTSLLVAIQPDSVMSPDQGACRPGSAQCTLGQLAVPGNVAQQNYDHIFTKYA